MVTRFDSRCARAARNAVRQAWELLDTDASGSDLLVVERGASVERLCTLRDGRLDDICTEPAGRIVSARFDGDRDHLLLVAETGPEHHTVRTLARDDQGTWTPLPPLPLPSSTVLLDIGCEGRVLLFTVAASDGTELLSYDRETGELATLYRDGGWVFAGSLAPDGRQVAFLRVGVDPLDATLLVSGIGRAPREYLRHEQSAALGRPAWAADGKTLLLSTNAGRDAAGIAAVDVESGEWSYCVSGAHDYDVRMLTNGRPITVENVDGASRLTLDAGVLRLPGTGVATLPPRPVLDADGWIALSFTSPGQTMGIWRAGVGRPAERLLPEVVETTAGVRPDRFWVTASDGVRVPVLDWRGVRPDEPAPVVVALHGGPEEQWRYRYTQMFTALTELGIAVLAPDLRGSLGFGKRYYQLDDGPKHVNAQLDLDAVYGCLGQRGFDPRRAVLLGTSFGGYQALQSITRPEAPWAAAVVISGVSDPIAHLRSTSPYRRAQRELTYGSPVHDRELLEQVSPLRNAGNVRTPLLLVHGALDARVPVEQARSMAAAVTRAGGQAWLHEFADEGHRINKAGNQVGLLSTVTEFVLAHTGGTQA